MNLLKKHKELLKKLIKKPAIKIAIILTTTLIFNGCAANTYDGKTLILAIPKDCEKQYVDYYKCEMTKTFFDRLLRKKCEAKPCDN